jgi:hypothetical protein
MNANLASIMPQVVAVWCQQEGHEVTLVCFTGREKLDQELPSGVDLVFICAFTQAALLAYSLSNYFQKQGCVTVLGGPHARCYPDDARKYFDFVTGFTTQGVIQEILADCVPQRPMGRFLSAKQQPISLPGVKERWSFLESNLKKAPFFKMISMIGSMGCPYTCAFCVDSEVPYQPLDFDLMKEDLRFVRKKLKDPIVGWHDPNFGIRFKDYMAAISDAVPPGSVRFVAESSLSILTEQNLKVMKENGFVGMLPGIESWYEMGNKSQSSRIIGQERVKKISDHVNMILEYIPYLQTNFVLGLDSDAGEEPFELTKRFVDASPGAFPGYSILTAFGEAAPLNLEYQKEGRVLPFPFHFLNNHLAMNVRLKNYDWVDFYDKVIDLTSYTFSRRAIYRRQKAASNFTVKWMNVMRAVSSEGYGRIRFFKKIRKMLVQDKAFKAYFDGETTELHEFYINIIKKDLGIWWNWLPEGAIYHDQNAYLKKSKMKGASTVVKSL